jgi:hypothetical protein
VGRGERFREVPEVAHTSLMERVALHNYLFRIGFLRCPCGAKLSLEEEDHEPG